MSWVAPSTSRAGATSAIALAVLAMSAPNSAALAYRSDGMRWSARSMICCRATGKAPSGRASFSFSGSSVRRLIITS